MKGYPKSIDDCIKELKECAKNAEYCEIESLLTWSSAYLKDYKKNYEDVSIDKIEEKNKCY